MRSLLRLIAPRGTPSKATGVQRDSIGFVLTDGCRIDVLRVRDPRARRVKLSVDERGARLTLPTRASLVSGERFLLEHRDWLTTQVTSLAVHANEGLVRGVTDCLPLRGGQVPLHWSSARAISVWRSTICRTRVPGGWRPNAPAWSMRAMRSPRRSKDWLPPWKPRPNAAPAWKPAAHALRMR